MNKFTSREKYEYLKKKAEMWREKSLDYKERYDQILEENEKLVTEKDEFQERFVDSDHVLKEVSLLEKEREKENNDLRDKLKEVSSRYKEMKKKLCMWEKQNDEEKTTERILKKVMERMPSS